MISTILSLITSHYLIAGGIGTVVTALLPFASSILSGGITTYVKIGLYALAALVLFGSGCYVTYKIMDGEVAQVQAQISAATAKANAQALKDEQAYEAKANAYITQANEDATKAQQAEATFRKEVYAQPKSYACTRTPAFGALLNAMRSSGAN